MKLIPSSPQHNKMRISTNSSKHKKMTVYFAHLCRGEVLLEPLDEPQPVPNIGLQATILHRTAVSKNWWFASILNSDIYKVSLGRSSLPNNLLLGVLFEWKAVGAELIATAEDYHVIGTLQINKYRVYSAWHLATIVGKVE